MSDACKYCGKKFEYTLESIQHFCHTTPKPTPSLGSLDERKFREFLIFENGYYAKEFSIIDEIEEGDIHAIEYAAIAEMQAEIDSLSVKLRRTVDAAYHALLETTAWMGIPEKKRDAQIEAAMSNVRYCAEHDLRHVDESQRNNTLIAENQKLREALEVALAYCSLEATWRPVLEKALGIPNKDNK